MTKQEFPIGSSRCMVMKREAEAYINMIKRLVNALQIDYSHDRAEMLRNADDAVEKLTKMFLDTPARGIGKVE